MGNGAQEFEVSAESALDDGRFQEADRLCRLAMQREPDNVKARVILGVLSAKSGKVPAGIQQIKAILRSSGPSFEVFYWLGTLLRMNGEFVEGAKYAQSAIELCPDSAKAWASLGSARGSLRQEQEAVDAFQRAADLAPERADYHHEMATHLQKLARFSEAFDAYNGAIAADPSFSASYAALAKLYRSQGLLAEAEDCAAQAFDSVPESVQAYFQLGRSFFDEDLVDEAEHCVRQAVRLDPQSPMVHAMLGGFLQRLGKFDESVASLQRAIELDPRRARPYCDLITCRKTSEEDRPMLRHVATLMQDGSLTVEDRRSLHYALGKAHNDLGDYRKAWQHFDEANGMMTIQLAGRTLNREAHTAELDRMIATFTPQWFAENTGLGLDSEEPIFIVGMIRSGTTLVEQIVSSHSDVAAGGELTYFPQRYLEGYNPKTGALSAGKAKEIASGYLDLLQGIAKGRSYVTDKMPQNFMLAGIIHAIFPNARIIHCRRHPVDTCVSIYTTPFPEPIQYAHDPDQIVYFYKEYQRIMEHWRGVLPTDRFLEVDYEDLVTDREAQTRKMIEFCGLEWSDDCLSHERNDGAIRTPSWWQARQPVYTSSIGRWKNYEPWLGPFRELL